jgi:hypothetical protein
VDVESYLLILGERKAVAWVLSTRRMAFPKTPRAEVAQLKPGDELFIYTTRGAFGNPTRDRGRIIARASAASPVTELDEPVEIAGRTFPRGCSLHVESLTPFRTGVELRPLVEHLDAFPNPQAWSIYLRRPLLHLPKQDADILRNALTPLARNPSQTLNGYLNEITPQPR